MKQAKMFKNMSVFYKKADNFVAYVGVYKLIHNKI